MRYRTLKDVSGLNVDPSKARDFVESALNSGNPNDWSKVQNQYDNGLMFKQVVDV